MSFAAEEPKEESPQPFLRPISPNDALNEVEEDVKPVWKRSYSKKVLPVVPIEKHSTGKTTMYIVAGQGAHREGQPGFAVIGRKAKALKGKASLEFTGELRSMEDGWTDEETLAGRRLVKLYRRQTGAKIEAHFHSVFPQVYDPTSVVISCIWNEKLQTKMVTHSDIIYSLTSLLLSTLGPEELSRVNRLVEFYEPDSYVVRAPVQFPPSFFNIPNVPDPNESDDDDDQEEGDGGGGGRKFYATLAGFEDPKPMKRDQKEIRFYPWSLLESILKSLIPTYRPYTYSFRPTYPNLPLFNKSVNISSISHPYSADQQPLKLHHGTFPIAPIPPSHLLESYQVEGLNVPRPKEKPVASGSGRRRASGASGVSGGRSSVGGSATKRKRRTKVEMEKDRAEAAAGGEKEEEQEQVAGPSSSPKAAKAKKKTSPFAPVEPEEEEECLMIELPDDEEPPLPAPPSTISKGKKRLSNHDYDSDEDEEVLVIIEEPYEPEEQPKKGRGRPRKKKKVVLEDEEKGEEEWVPPTAEVERDRAAAMALLGMGGFGVGEEE